MLAGFEGNPMRAVAALSCLLAGCAVTPSAPDPRIAAIDSTRPTCSTTTECQAKWRAAQLWVANNAAYRIATATDVLIQTHSPGYAKTHIAMQVTLEPRASGGSVIVGRIWCGNMFTCVPDPLDSMLRFHAAVNAAK